MDMEESYSLKKRYSKTTKATLTSIRERVFSRMVGHEGGQRGKVGDERRRDNE